MPKILTNLSRGLQQPSEYQTHKIWTHNFLDTFFWFSNGLIMWLGWPFECQIFWTIKVCDVAWTMNLLHKLMMNFDSTGSLLLQAFIAVLFASFSLFPSKRVMLSTSVAKWQKNLSKNYHHHFLGANLKIVFEMSVMI